MSRAELNLSANTSFADFPRLCRAVAENHYLPYPFAYRGRRLVFSYGIYVLAVISGSLLVLFKGVTDRLIPLFAVGAFLAFTLSQAGMVMHWKRIGGSHARTSMVINGIGAVATGVALIIVLLTKFIQGAWVTTLLIAGLVLLMSGVRRHYLRIFRETSETTPPNLSGIPSPIVVLPMERWSRIEEKALCFAYSISRDIFVVHIVTEEETKSEKADLRKVRDEYIEKPAREGGPETS